MEFDWISIMILTATLGFWGFVTVGKLSRQKKEKESPTNSARSASEPNDTPKQANDLAEQPFAAQSEDPVSEAVQAKQAQSVRDPSPNRNNAGTVVGVLALLIIGVIVYLLYAGILQEMIKNAIAFILAIMLLLLFGSTSSEDQSKKKSKPRKPSYSEKKRMKEARKKAEDDALWEEMMLEEEEDDWDEEHGIRW